MNGKTQGTASPATMNKVDDNPALPLMSKEGSAMASHSAPQSAFEVRTTSTPAVKEK